MHIIKITDEAHSIMVKANNGNTEGSMRAGLGMYAVIIDDECKKMLDDARIGDESDSSIIKRIF